MASTLARLPPAKGQRAGILTHSGGAALLLADLAERQGVELPHLGHPLREQIEPLLDHGSASNPVDMGGIIGGPARFAEALGRLAASGEFDAVMAVSTPHPPSHTDERVASLLAIRSEVPVVHLWMAGDQAAAGLAELRRHGAPVTEDPRAAVGTLAALLARPAASDPVEAVTGPLEDWGLPLDEGIVVSSVDAALEAACVLGYPVVAKADFPGLSQQDRDRRGAVGSPATGRGR